MPVATALQKTATPAGSRRPLVLRVGDALVLVDVQFDFLAGGSLPVPSSDEVIPALNRCVAAFHRAGLPVVATRDWHPRDPSSFQHQGGPWPPHCVAGSHGAELSTRLILPPQATLVSKVTAPQTGAYSAFEGTDLDDLLRKSGVTRLFVGGLATDYCVLHTVCDALKRGYQVVVLLDAIRAVDLHAGDGERAIADMRKAGATTANSSDIPA